MASKTIAIDAVDTEQARRVAARYPGVIRVLSVRKADRLAMAPWKPYDIDVEVEPRKETDHAEA